MGFAKAPATVNALAGQGVRISGYQWRWAVGLKDGTYPPHLELDHDVEPFEHSFEAQPGEDWNGDACMCAIVPQYRGPDGRYAKPGVEREPRFAPPVFPATASLVPYPVPEPIDWSPLVAALSERTPQEFMLSVPEGTFTINLPELSPSFHVAAPNVKVESPEVTVQPTFQVESPTVNVQPPVVHVAAPNVTVSPNIEIKPVVKVIREKVARAVRFRRNSSGQIEEAEVTSEQ